MYGIYNTYAKAFQFGICEETKNKARKKLFKKIGKDAYKWRFEVRKINNTHESNKNILKKKENEIMNVKATRTGTKVTTGKVRLSYAHLFEPHAIEGNEPKYSVSVIIPKTDTETLKAIKEATDQAKKDGASKWGGKVPPTLKTPLRDGDTERPDDEAYAGCYFLNANSKNKPGVVDANVQPILDATEVYSGCYGRLTLNFYAYNANGNKGVAAGLGNVQKLEDGEPLGGFTRAEDDFTAVGSAEDDFLG
ncbi:hypothetical protein B0H39_002184 [Clostridium beijerinckii]|uniref:DUF2815 family protein n=2 Tax=Clostridium beijerinckii TaxID=1520 RepID=A0AAX0AYS4_CLOBE|nr:hypothetical protein [Clostridium beijerinckii]NRT88129.1 hypothetical protein [Clostridium beijerinckii]NYC73557.1 hypothetical protein [Clostridium beijerinckii]